MQVTVPKADCGWGVTAEASRHCYIHSHTHIRIPPDRSIRPPWLPLSPWWPNGSRFCVRQSPRSSERPGVTVVRLAFCRRCSGASMMLAWAAASAGMPPFMAVVEVARAPGRARCAAGVALFCSRREFLLAVRRRVPRQSTPLQPATALRPCCPALRILLRFLRSWAVLGCAAPTARCIRSARRAVRRLHPRMPRRRHPVLHLARRREIRCLRSEGERHSNGALALEEFQTTKGVPPDVSQDFRTFRCGIGPSRPAARPWFESQTHQNPRRARGPTSKSFPRRRL
jgi:hypothetical protein